MRQADRALAMLQPPGRSTYATAVGGCAIALLTWSLTSIRPTYGLDPSWVEGLHLAHIHRISYGSRFVWTYGPLGYLSFPLAVSTATLIEAMVFSTAAALASCILLVHITRRFLPLPLALIVAYVAAQLPMARGDAPVFVLVLYACASLNEPRSALARTFAWCGPAVAAIALFTKTSSGAVAVGIWAVTAIGLARARPRLLAASLAIFVVWAAGAWVAAGDSLAQLPDWVRLSVAIVAGYGEAMQGDDGRNWELTVALIILALLALSLARRGSLDREQRVPLFLVVAAFAFIFFKEGFVRKDFAHTPYFFTATALVSLAVASRRVRVIPLGIMLVCCLAIQHAIGLNFSPVNSTRNAYDQWHATLSGAERSALISDSASYQRSVYGIPDDFMAAIGRTTVAVYPHNTAIIGAYGLNWDPLPVMQQYSAYTRSLDHLNAAHVEGPAAPNHLIRELDTAAQIGYAPSVYAPETYRAILCSYAQVAVTDYWQLLRHTRDRCGAPRPLARVRGTNGVPISVPRARPGEIVIARVWIGSTIWNKLLGLIYKPDMPRITVGDEGTSLLPTATAPAGLVVHVPSTAGWDPRFDGSVDAKTLVVTNAAMPIHVEFEAIRLTPPAS
jgi:hypothetical protein